DPSLFPESDSVKRVLLHRRRTASGPIDPQPRQPQRLYSPLTSGFLIRLMVMAVAVQGGLALGPSQLVLHRPDAARGAVRCDFDLGHMAVMYRDDAFQHLAHERYDLVASLDFGNRFGGARRPLLADVHNGVGSEHVLPSGPLLG